MADRDTIIKFAEILNVDFKITTDNISIQCPFALWNHAGGRDNNPSFSIKISDENSPYFCFSCHEKGKDIRDVADKLSQRDFSDQLKLDKLIELFPTEGKKIVRRSFESVIYNNEFTSLYYCPKEMILEENLLDYFVPLKPEYLEDSRGINNNTQNCYSLFYDVLERRIIFPVRWYTGELVGIIGRATKPGYGPKYYNYKKFNKSFVLFGEHLLERREVVLVEGPFDCLKVRQAGFNSVAITGSYLSDKQAEKLVEFNQNVTLFFDGDKAGSDATKHAKNLLLSYGLKAKIKRPPTGLDPGEMSIEDIKNKLGGE